MLPEDPVSPQKFRPLPAGSSSALVPHSGHPDEFLRHADTHNCLCENILLSRNDCIAKRRYTTDRKTQVNHLDRDCPLELRNSARLRRFSIRKFRRRTRWTRRYSRLDATRRLGATAECPTVSGPEVTVHTCRMAAIRTKSNSVRARRIIFTKTYFSV